MYWAVVTGNDIQESYTRLRARSQRAARAEAWRKLRGGYHHHTVLLATIDNGRLRVVAARSMASRRWITVAY